MRYLRQLAKLMTNGEDGRYNDDFKERFRSVGKKAMEELAQILELKEFDISFNPGGIAVSGDLRLMGMWGEGNGVYISMNKDFPGKPWGDVLYRHIQHMRDFTGGPNNYFKFCFLGNPAALRKTIMRLKRDDGHSLVAKASTMEWRSVLVGDGASVGLAWPQKKKLKRSLKNMPGGDHDY